MASRKRPNPTDLGGGESKKPVNTDGAVEEGSEGVVEPKVNPVEGMEVIDFTSFTTLEQDYLYALNPRLKSVSFKLVKTTMLENLSQFADAGGMVILKGPKGTGKSCALFYLMKILKMKNKRALLVSPERNDDTNVIGYLNSFIQEQYSAEERMNVPMAETSYTKFLRNVINAAVAEIFLLVEMGYFMKLENRELDLFLKCLHRAVMIPHISIVIASSSGSGWKSITGRETTAGTNVCELWLSITSELSVFQFSNFTSEEASLYMKEHNINEEKWKQKVFTVTGWNPLLLSCFKNCDEKKYSSAVRHVHYYVQTHIDDLLNLKGKPFLQTTLGQCEKWLMHAHNFSEIDNEEKEDFEISYVGEENLAYYIKCDPAKFTLALAFPTLYVSFIKRLKLFFHAKEEEYLRSPTVQGLIFEEDVLQNLQQLHINIANREGDSRHVVFHFCSASYQLDSTLKEMDRNMLYHLHIGHIIIDGVCVAQDSNKVWWLLLIQVSLSAYSGHKSGAEGIRKKFPTQTTTLLEYYRHLIKDDQPIVAEDHVIYVYLSPAKCDTPAVIAIDRVKTKYWCGTVSEDSPTMTFIKTREQLVRSS